MPKVKVEHQGRLKFLGTGDNGGQVTMDTQPENGGANEGITPMQNVLTSLGACSGMDVVAILRNQKIELSGYEINIEAENADSHPHVFTKIDVEHVLHGKGLDYEKAKVAVEKSTTTYCSVIAMLSKTANINVTFRIVED